MVNKQDKQPIQDEPELVTNEIDNTDTEFELVEVEDNLAVKIKKLQTKLRKAEQEKQQLQNDLQRERADFLNAKRRLSEEQVNAGKKLTRKHLENLLPLADSFTMAMADKTAWEKADASWRQGVEGIYSQLKSLLAGYQVTSVEPLGEEFDPTLHDAVGNIPTNEADKHHKVLQVLQLGYKIDEGGQEEVLRPARVLVGEYVADTTKE